MTDAVTRETSALSGDDVYAGSDGSAAERIAFPLGNGGEEGVLSKREAAEYAPASELQSELPGELVEPGRALALADFSPPAIGAGERLIRLAYRFGVPASILTAPFGKTARPRLRATVSCPLAGNKIAGTGLRAGHFLVHGARTPISQADFGGAGRLTPPVERYVHSFAWLADLDAAGVREQVAPVAERIAAAWLDANEKAPPRPGKGPAWNVGNAGLRVIAWLVHAPLLLAGSESPLHSRMLAAIAEGARWLDRNVTRADDRFDEVCGWAGIVAAGLLLPHGKPRRLFGEAGLIKALGELVGSDGGVLSRSPLVQMETIALLVRLRACYKAGGVDVPRALDTMIGLMVPPLLALSHGDGSLGSWQGGWAIGADEVARLCEAAGVRTRPLRDVRQWGYQRVVARKSVLLFDAAPPPLPRHGRAGCASTLAFELSHAGHRLIVNCGGGAAAGGLIPLRLEQPLRATAAHSTLAIDDSNSTAVLLGGKIGEGVSEVDVARRTLEGERNSGATRLEASHDGYAQRYGLIHRRILILRDDGSELRGEDMLVPQGRKGKRGKVGYAIRFHLGAGVEAALSPDGQGAGLALPDGSYWQVRTGGGEVTLEESLWADSQGRPVPVQQLVIQGLVSRGGGTFAWLLKKMG